MDELRQAVGDLYVVVAFDWASAQRREKPHLQLRPRGQRPRIEFARGVRLAKEVIGPHLLMIAYRDGGAGGERVPHASKQVFALDIAWGSGNGLRKLAEIHWSHRSCAIDLRVRLRRVDVLSDRLRARGGWWDPGLAAAADAGFTAGMAQSPFGRAQRRKDSRRSRVHSSTRYADRYTERPPSRAGVSRL